jgi:23S rRNA-/tRNA-specific pseudouridylate synthase
MILYNFNNLAVLHKPAGQHSDEFAHKNLPEGWKTAHRLDADTSGLLVCATGECLEKLHQQFKIPGDIQKFYIAGASEALKPEVLNKAVYGTIHSRYRSSKKVRFVFEDAPAILGHRSAQSAETIVRHATKPLLGFEAFKGNLYEVQLVTGHRHQIRATFAALKAPLVGDVLYGGPTSSRLELHAWKIALSHPLTGEALTFSCTPG